MADRVPVLSDGAADVLAGRGVARERLRVVPTWIDVDEIRPAERGEDFRAAHGVAAEDSLVLASGNIGQLGGLDCVADAMALLRPVERLRLFVAGRGNYRRHLQERAEVMGLDRVTLLDAVPREEFPPMLAAADLCLVARDGRFAGHDVPSRAYPFWAAARPLVAVLHEDNEISRVARVEGAGFWAPQDEPVALAGVLRQAMATPRAELAAMGRRGRAFVEREHRREQLTRRWERELQRGHLAE